MLSEIWRAIIAFLVWLSADPAAVDLEAPRAAAAVAAALASMTPDAPPPPGPTPVACDCGQTCVRGIWKPDGRVQQICRCPCTRCVAERAKGCPDGNCPLPQNVLR
jgi:hypothetical protein